MLGDGLRPGIMEDIVNRERTAAEEEQWLKDHPGRQVPTVTPWVPEYEVPVSPDTLDPPFIEDHLLCDLWERIEGAPIWGEGRYHSLEDMCKKMEEYREENKQILVGFGIIGVDRFRCKVTAFRPLDCNDAVPTCRYVL